MYLTVESSLVLFKSDYMRTCVETVLLSTDTPISEPPLALVSFKVNLGKGNQNQCILKRVL